MEDKTQSNVLFAETKHFRRSDGDNGTIVGAEIRVRLVRCEINGVVRLYRRLWAFPVAGPPYDLYEGDPTHDTEILFEKGTPESVAVRKTIEAFDELCEQIAADSNTYSPANVYDVDYDEGSQIFN